MKKTLPIAILAVLVTLGANGAWANGPYPTNLTDGTYGTPGIATPNSNTGEFELYQAVNNLLANSATPSSYTNNSQLDPLEYTGSTSTWAATEGSNGGYAFIGLGAGATNTLDVYNTSTPNTLVNVFGGGFTGYSAAGTGTSSDPYPGVGSVVTPTSDFGFVLSSNNPFTNTITNWNSNPGANSDSMDHMIVYNLTALEGATIYVKNPSTDVETAVTLNDPYLIGFEDLPLNDNGANSDMDYNDYIVLVDGIAPVPEPMTVALFGFGLLAMAGFALRRKLAFVA